ncbi:hypothetical protein BJX68DRAFT_245356 [Aspergillus pseudodeflectus]|uniref:Uncharacterized protein n=1 Tax=Aspergillus pseudodeflectus TaxID=176178 RepID=A0ABR4JNQ2_9EURO
MPSRAPRSYGSILEHSSPPASPIITRSYTSVHKTGTMSIISALCSRLPSSHTKKHTAYQSIDLDQEAFKAYFAQRWLWNEPAQLQRRYFQSNLNALPGHCRRCCGI